jgi:hypothetical protein
MMAVTVEELYEQAKALSPAERRRLATLLSQPLVPMGTLAEQLRAARAQIVATGEPLLDWQAIVRERRERGGE